MANETPNRLHAGGTFVGTAAVAPPFTARAINSKGVQAFARLDVGLYRLTFQRPLAFHEGEAEASLPAGFAGIATAQIENDAAGAIVVVQNLTGARVDPPVLSVTVWAVTEGEGAGPDGPVLPVPPASGGTLDLYVDPTGGSDDGEGTQASPLQTLARAYELAPYLVAPGGAVLIHLRADTYPAAPIPPKALAGPLVHFADEAWDPTVYTQNFNGVAGGATVAGSVDITALGLAINAVRNQFLRFTDGAAAGQIRLIRNNTAVAAIPALDFNPAPGAGDAYEIFEADGAILDFDALPGGAMSTWVYAGGRIGANGEGDGGPVMLVGCRAIGTATEPQILDCDVALYGVACDGVALTPTNARLYTGHDGATNAINANASIVARALGLADGNTYVGWGAVAEDSTGVPLMGPQGRLELISNHDGGRTWGEGHARYRAGSVLINSAGNAFGMVRGRFNVEPFTGHPVPTIENLGAGGAILWLEAEGLLNGGTINTQAGTALAVERMSRVAMAAATTGQSAAGLSVSCRYVSQMVLFNGAPAFGRAPADTDWTTGVTTTDRAFFAADGTTLFEAVSPFAGSFISRQG